MSPCAPRRSSPRAGFTLLEMMIAVVILGGALAVLYRSIIVSARMVASGSQSMSRERYVRASSP